MPGFRTIAAAALMAGAALPASLAFHASRIHKRFGPGVPRRFLAYLALAATDLVLMLTDSLHKGKDNSGGGLLIVLMMMIPLLVRTESAPRLSGDRGMAFFFLIGIFLLHQIFYGIMAWARFEDGHLTGLAGLLLVIYIPFYILAHDPKQD